jgi:3-deoxy-manno-octulosonate cytidylyltransferase (CMP-KDO synthetase)
MEIVVIIPARYASARLPGKPLAPIAGKPMIQHVYERAARATLVRDVLVATDDERIARAVETFGGRVLMTPQEIRSGSDRIAHVARGLITASVIVNVQGDEPLIEPSMIDAAIRPLAEDPSLLMSTLVRVIDTTGDLHNPAIVKVVLDRQDFCLCFSRSAIPYLRDAGTAEWHRHHRYYQHIGLYVYRREFLLEFAQMRQTPLELAEKLEQMRVLEHGYRIKAVVTTERSIPVDTPEDLTHVRSLIGHHA